MERESIKQMAIQGLGYAVLIFFGVWLMLGQLGAVKKEVQVKATLHTIREGLQAYYAEKETYVKMSPSSGAALIEILQALGYLEKAPLNPYTGKPYSVDDTEDDKIQYEAGEDFKSFRLSAKKPKSDEVWLAIEIP